MKDVESNALGIIELWFKARCDGVWEHQKGLALTTTDNPGWLLTIDEPLDESKVKDLVASVRDKWEADCLLNGHNIKVYAATLRNCLCAAADILSAVNEK